MHCKREVWLKFSVHALLNINGILNRLCSACKEFKKKHQSNSHIFFRKLLSKLNNSNESFTHFLKTLFFEAWICNFEPSSVITDWHVSKELVGLTGTRCSGSRGSMLCLRCIQTCSYTQITCQNIAI